MTNSSKSASSSRWERWALWSLTRLCTGQFRERAFFHEGLVTDRTTAAASSLIKGIKVAGNAWASELSNATGSVSVANDCGTSWGASEPFISYEKNTCPSTTGWSAIFGHKSIADIPWLGMAASKKTACLIFSGTWFITPVITIPP